MHNEYKAFLRILRPVSRYAVDLTHSEINQPGINISDKLRRDFIVDADRFLDSMYEERGYEKVIYTFLRTSGDFICLVGPKGSGKTSIGTRITRTLAQSRRHGVYIVFLNLRVLCQLYDFESYSRASFRTFLLEQIKNRYNFDLFTYVSKKGEPNPEIRLWAYLLQRVESMPSEFFGDLVDLQNDAARLFSAFQSEDSENREGFSYYDWLIATHHADPDIRDLTKKLKKMIKIPHLVYAARFIYHYNRQFLWFDNIDALPVGLQSEIISVIKGNHGLAPEYVSSVAAVREENVFRRYDIEHGAPPHLTRVAIEVQKNEKGYTYYPSADEGHPALGVPVINRRVLNKIVEKRLVFARDYQEEKVKAVEAEIKVEQEALEKETDAAKCAYIQQKIQEMEEELIDYKPIITADRFEHIKQLSRKMLDALHLVKAIHLANNSVRDFLLIHRDFLAELLKSPNEDSDPPEALDYEPREILTIFFRWIRMTRRSFRFGIYDIIEETNAWYKEGKKWVGCILPHLVITTIWNLTLENAHWLGDRKHYINPTVKEVEDRLASIGFEPKRIRETIYSLYKEEESRGHVVEFRSKSFISRIDQIENDHIVYVTYRGKCFVGLTCNTFGYLYECIEQLKKGEEYDKRGSSKHQSHPHRLSSADQARKVLPYLCDIAQMHYDTLKELRDTVYQKDPEWLVSYRRKFGIPCITPYRLKSGIGVYIKGIRRALQFEALIDGVLGYFRREGTGEEILRLQNFFQQTLEKLEKFEEPKDNPVDFRKEFGLPMT